MMAEESPSDSVGLSESRPAQRAAGEADVGRGGPTAHAVPSEMDVSLSC